MHAFLDRQIEGDSPHLWTRATRRCVRSAGSSDHLGSGDLGRGVNADGRREILAMDMGPSEAGTF